MPLTAASKQPSTPRTHSWVSASAPSRLTETPRNRIRDSSLSVLRELGLSELAGEQAVIALCRDILSRHAIPPRHVLAHSDVAPGRKIDPGVLRERFRHG